jgi:hypothetical protein
MQARCDIDTLGLRNAGTPTQAFTGSTEVRGASFGLVAALARNCEQLGRRFDVRRRGAALGGIHGAYAPLASAAGSVLALATFVPVYFVWLGADHMAQLPTRGLVLQALGQRGPGRCGIDACL